jgi:hypothetical protein
MTRKLLFLLLLISPFANAQDLLVPYWFSQNEYGDANVTEHMTNRLNILHFAYSYFDWDESNQHFVSAVPQMLQYKKIIGSGYKKVNVSVANFNDPKMSSDKLGKLTPFAITRILDSCFKVYKPSEKISLLYNENGFLQQRIRQEELGIRQVKKMDTVSFHYTTLADGSKCIERVISNFDHQKKVHGKGKRTKFMSITHDFYYFNPKGELISNKQNGAVKLNGKVLDYKAAHLATYTYDSIGRPLIIQDSSTTLNKIMFRFDYAYEDIPLTSTMDSARYPILKSSILRKWLLSFPSLILSKTAVKGYHMDKNSQTNRTDTNYLVISRPYTLLMQLDTSRFLVTQNMVYQHVQDSGNIYRGRYLFGSMGNLKDTVTYNPLRKELPRYDPNWYRPAGTFQMQSFMYFEQNTVEKKGEWQMIVKKRAGGAGYYWAPQKFRYTGNDQKTTSFTLLDPAGLVRYYCEYTSDGGLTAYQLSYK